MMNPTQPQEHLPDDQSISKPVIEMITLANEYCLFFEKAAAYKREDILYYFQKVAPLLYLKGAMLPAVEVSDPGAAERFVTEEQWESIFKALREQFLEFDVYHIHDHNQDSVEASLADNMADIYQDMKDFVMLYQKKHGSGQTTCRGTITRPVWLALGTRDGFCAGSSPSDPL